MAIKPNDCVIRIEDLVVGTKKAIDSWNGKEVEVPRYEKYWENFNDHVDKLVSKIDTKTWNWKDWKHSPTSVTYEQELKKFNAVHKETKNYKDRYIKFKSHKHLTLFIMRWS